jgi:hypothetical protein
MKPDAPVTRAVVKGNLGRDCKRGDSYYSHSEREEESNLAEPVLLPRCFAAHSMTIQAAERAGPKSSW